MIPDSPIVGLECPAILVWFGLELVGFVWFGLELGWFALVWFDSRLSHVQMIWLGLVWSRAKPHQE